MINYFVYMHKIKEFEKMKKTGDHDINNENIQPWYKMEFGIEKCAMLIMTSEKREGPDEQNL